MCPGQVVVLQPSARGRPGLPDRRPARRGGGGDRTRRADLGRGEVPDRLRPQRHDLRSPARGGVDRRLDRRLRRHDDQRLPRALGHGLSGRRRGDLHPGRDQEPRRPDHLLGLQPGREPPAPLHQVQPDAQGDVPPPRPQGPLLRAGRRPQDQERQGGRPVHPDQAAQGFRGALGLARPGQGRGARRRRDRGRDRRSPGHLAGLDGADEAGQVRRDPLRHGPDDDARQAPQQLRPARLDPRHERPHAVRLQADARPRQRHRRRQRRHLADRLSVRREPGARLSPVQPRRVHDDRHARPRRGRRGADHRQRPDVQLHPGGPRAPGPHPLHRPGPQGHTHHPQPRPSSSTRRPTGSTPPAPSIAWTTCRSPCVPPSSRPFPATKRSSRGIERRVRELNGWRSHRESSQSHRSGNRTSARCR